MALIVFIKNKIYQDRRAVSPIIGTVLMIAMTLVIASILFIWLMSFTNMLNIPDRLKPLLGDSENEQNNNLILVDFSVNKDNGNYTVKIKYISQEISLDRIRFYLKDKSDTSIEYGYISEILNDEFGNITFYDYDNNNKISNFDVFFINGEIIEDDMVLELSHAELGNGVVKIN